MSDEKKPSLLLEPEKRGAGSYILPAALAAGGVALLYTTVKKGDSKKSGSSLSAAANEVAFSSSYGSYKVGKDYEQLVVESYLSEQAEDGNLHLADGGDALVGQIYIPEEEYIKRTRAEVLSAFKATHKARVGKEKVLISKLPQDKTGVQKFNKWLEAQVKNFQETY